MTRFHFLPRLGYYWLFEWRFVFQIRDTARHIARSLRRHRLPLSRPFSLEPFSTASQRSHVSFHPKSMCAATCTELAFLLGTWFFLILVMGKVKRTNLGFLPVDEGHRCLPTGSTHAEIPNISRYSPSSRTHHCDKSSTHSPLPIVRNQASLVSRATMALPILRDPHFCRAHVAAYDPDRWAACAV